jgi:hypothetical protein
MAFRSARGAEARIVSLAVVRGESFLPLQHSQCKTAITPDERRPIPRR